MNEKKFVIVDLDGTLCDTRHRDEFAEARDWDAFHARLGDDPIRESVAAVVRWAHDSGLTVIAITGRPERYRTRTIDWMHEARVAHCISALFMRGDDDFRKAPAVKESVLVELFGSVEHAAHEILFAIEDDDRLVEFYRGIKIDCFQV